jgi:DNA polymerase III subunit epsilon
LIGLSGGPDKLMEGFKNAHLHNLHPLLDSDKIEDLPEETGVYYFYNEKKELIYTGKSKNLYNRVLNHLANIKTRKTQNLRDMIADIDYELTGSELIALLIESDQIKKFKPLFNRSQRRTTFSWGLYDYIDDKGYNCIKISKNNSESQPFATFEALDFARESLMNLAEKYNLCQKLCGLYETNGACFHYSIKKCHGACISEESPDTYNSRVEELIKRFGFEKQNFFVIDKGRNTDEKSVVKIENGQYQGFGFIDITSAITLEEMNNSIKKYQDNRDVRQIIRNYIRRNKVEKIIPF